MKRIADDLKFTDEYKHYGYLTKQDLLVFKNNVLAENRKKREQKALFKEEQMVLMLIQAPQGSKFRMTVGTNNMNSSRASQSSWGVNKPIYKLLIEAPKDQADIN